MTVIAAMADGFHETAHTAAKTLCGAPSAVYAYVDVETAATANVETVEVEVVDVEVGAAVADAEVESAAAAEPVARSAEESK